MKSETNSKDFEKIYAVDKDLSFDHSLVIDYLSDQGVKSFEDLEDLEDAQFDQILSYMRNVPKKKIMKWLNRL